jgi:hypothetical protein
MSCFSRSHDDAILVEKKIRPAAAMPSIVPAISPGRYLRSSRASQKSVKNRAQKVVRAGRLI